MFKLDEKDIDPSQKSASAQCLLGLSAILKFVTQDGSHCDALVFYTGKWKEGKKRQSLKETGSSQFPFCLCRVACGGG